jgi:hypothetical protein
LKAHLDHKPFLARNVFPKGKPAQSIREKREQAERSNLESAALILREADKFGGDTSLAVRWARALLARTPEAARYNEHGQREMFGGAQ